MFTCDPVCSSCIVQSYIGGKATEWHRMGCRWERLLLTNEQIWLNNNTKKLGFSFQFPFFCVSPVAPKDVLLWQLSLEWFFLFSLLCVQFRLQSILFRVVQNRPHQENHALSLYKGRQKKQLILIGICPLTPAV